MDIETRIDCRGAHYCGHWRICERCARIRAARFADRAEYLQQRFGRLALAVAKPEDNTAKCLKALRDRLIRAKLAPAGMWTIETGSLFAGLHLNLLLPEHITDSARHRLEYVEPIRTSARAAAAYICKRTGMPPPSQYAGRLQGEWGSVMQHIFRTHDIAAAPSQAAALQLALSGPRSISDFYKTDKEMAAKIAAQHDANKPKTRDEYAAIMRRNLSAVYLSLRQHQQ